MKLKKLLALLLSLVLVLNFTSCGNSDTSDSATTTNTTSANTDDSTAPDNTDDSDIKSSPAYDYWTDYEDTDSTIEIPEEITPLLYKVTDADGNTIWIFGSIHIGEEYFYPLPDYVMDAYNASEALAVEFDITSIDPYDYDMLMSDYIYDMMYSDYSEINDHIPDYLYEEAKEILKEYDLYSYALDYYKPGLWSEFIDDLAKTKLDMKAELGIDYFFLNTAHEENKKIYDIESLEFQMRMPLDYSEDLQIWLLQSSIESYKEVEEYQDTLDEMLVDWAIGNEEAFVDDESDYQYMSRKMRILYDEYNKIMTLDRNITMADFAEDSLASGEEVFIVVGAGHVVGNGGMTELLTERGYTVELIQG